MLKMQQVKSSNVSEIGYDDVNREIHIKYKTGITYKYLNTSELLFSRLQKAESIGRFISEEIKCAGYSYEKVN